MLDVKNIRENPEIVRKMLIDRSVSVDLERFLELDQHLREQRVRIEGLQAERNKLAKENTPENSKRSKEIKEELEKITPHDDKEYNELLLSFPNVPLPDVPVGQSDADNIVLDKFGAIPQFDFPPLDHVEMGKKLGLIDIETAGRVSGSRFAYLKKEAVLLEFALIQLALKELTAEGFIPVLPPVLIKKEITEGLGYWSGGGNENYYQVHEPENIAGGLYLVGTAEHSLVPMHSGEVLKEEDLPRRYVGFSPSFRREAGSYGQDVRGILRVHQFDKVEMVSFTTPEKGATELEFLLSLEKRLFTLLQIPFQVVQICTGDLSYPSAKSYDLEAWLPSQNRYREVTSTSLTTDYQARRMNIKYERDGQKEFVHILNGTGFAIGRTLIAILENYQEADGSVRVPEVLQEYVGKDLIKAS